MSFSSAQPSSRPAYPLVDSLQRRTGKNSDGTSYSQVRLYNATGGALTAGGWYMIAWGGTTATAQNPRVIVPATTALMREFVVALAALADASYGWFAYSGYVDALVDGTSDVTAGHFVKLVNGSTAVVTDGATYTANTVAVCLPGQTTNAPTSTRCFLIGRATTI